MANEAPTDGQHGADVWMATQIQGLGRTKISVADMSVADRADLAALRFGAGGASCLLIDDLDVLRDTLYEALHQCNELEVKRQQGG
jgi:hypothetical protein